MAPKNYRQAAFRCATGGLKGTLKLAGVDGGCGEIKLAGDAGIGGQVKLGGVNGIGGPVKLSGVPGATSPALLRSGNGKLTTTHQQREPTGQRRKN